jgi:hypothetical protein
MSTTAYLYGRNATIITNPDPLRINDIVRMHAIGMEAAKDFDYCTGRIINIRQMQIVIMLITAPLKPLHLIGSSINFYVSGGGWGCELLPGEWDF